MSRCVLVRLSLKNARTKYDPCSIRYPPRWGDLLLLPINSGFFLFWRQECLPV